MLNHPTRLLFSLCVCFFAFGDRPATAKEDRLLQADIVVYGDASGGVTAAVQAARMGKTVILVSQYGHLGGMTSSGLGWTDIGNTDILGGLSHEFYRRVYLHYQQAEAWEHEPQEEFANKGQGPPALDDERQLASTFEPKVAEAVFDELVKEAGVGIVLGRIDLETGVSMEGKRITALHLENGQKVKGKMFIDASYEGDLMAAAKVSFRVGRESNSEFDEAGNGITGPLRGCQLPDGIDPYVMPGDASSGLLPGVNPTMGGPVGTGDHRFQAYCYRMVLTDVPTNRRMIEKPANYDDSDYEILFRAIEVGQHSRFFETNLMPNRKTDSNNASGISCDLIAGNYGPDWNWATLNHKEREEVAEKHRDWQLGLVWTVQNHPRVPENVRKAHAIWGLAKDEFSDNDNWPYNLYVREARRMASEFVMTEKHCRNKLPVVDSVGLGAYTLDSHNTQRIVHNGMVKNEGDIQSRLNGPPYRISYRALTPRADECENLLVPWALS
ncbi:MAG: FAD-dependent oxidoreductase, partial [Lacipirellulaceae bacterium]